MVQRVHRTGEVVRLQTLLDLRARTVDPREDPALEGLLGPCLDPGTGRVRKDQARHVPELVRKLATLLDRPDREAHVLRGRHLQQPVARGVRAVVLDRVEGIDPRAEALRHPPPVRRVDRRVDVDRVERNVAHQLEPGHDHSRLPEEDDPAVGRADVVRIPRAQLGRVVRPAERREGPQRRREPRVEDVLVLTQLARPAFRTRRGRRLGDADVTVGAVPRGDLMSPPQLAGDAPGADRLHPVEVDLRVALGAEANASVAHGRDRGARKLGHVAPPLQRDERLDPVAGPVTVRDGVPVGLGGLEQPLGLEARDDARRRLLLGQARELARLVVHPRVEADHRQLRQTVVAPDLPIHRIVAGRDLHRARAELRVDAIVLDDRERASDDRQHRLLADQTAVALVAGMDCDGDIGEHRRRPHRGNRDVSGAVRERVSDRVQRVRRLLVVDLEVRDRTRAARAPVHDAVGAEEIAAFAEVDEPAQDGAHVTVVHRHPLAPIVERCAQATKLAHDHAPVLLQPRPGPLEELLAAEVVPCQAFLGQVLLDDGLRRDPRVVVAGLPHGVEAAHAMPADEQVLDRRVQRVAHVQVARDVGRRDAHHERLAVGIGLCRIQPFLFPRPLPARFHALRLVQRFHRAIVASASEAAQRADELTQRLCRAV